MPGTVLGMEESTVSKAEQNSVLTIQLYIELKSERVIITVMIAILSVNKVQSLRSKI